MPEPASLVLRLAGPLQSWGSDSQFNRRETRSEPTKSGITGLLAAAQGRRRSDPIEDLLRLRLGVRTDRPGSLLRDYHTVSDYRGRPLLSASVNATGAQTLTSPAKYTHITHRYYLQDAVFVAALSGPSGLLQALAEAIRKPAFPLALGRRACVPTQPLLLPSPTGEPLWSGAPLDVLTQVHPQGSPDGQAVSLPVTIDDTDTPDPSLDNQESPVLVADLPVSFDPRNRAYGTRRVRHTWVHLNQPTPPADGNVPDTETRAAGPDDHDPFALLGW